MTHEHNRVDTFPLIVSIEATVSPQNGKSWINFELAQHVKWKKKLFSFASFSRRAFCYPWQTAWKQELMLFAGRNEWRRPVVWQLINCHCTKSSCNFCTFTTDLWLLTHTQRVPFSTCAVVVTDECDAARKMPQSCASINYQYYCENHHHQCLCWHYRF